MSTAEATLLHYEIINPSDCVTFVCENETIACNVLTLLGSGQYGGDCLEDSTKDIPIFMLGGFDAWWKQRHGDKEVGVVLKENLEPTCVALESCMCLGFNERKEVETAVAGMTPEERTMYIKDANDKKRSSMNDICGRAFEIAKKIRANNPDLPQPPQQVFSSL